MTKLNTPFRYDYVGSFLRPTALKQARTDFENGKITADELKAVEDKAIIDLVEKQKKAGYHVITDGEFRRATWHLDFMWGFKGVAHKKTEKGVAFSSEAALIDDTWLTGKISGENHPFVEHFKFVKNLEDENYKNCIELEEYKTLNEKYEHSRIMNHDFREHLNVLKTLISEDIQKAQEYVGKIEKECEDSKIEKYSDNNILNILLIRKKKECEENGIKLNITSTNPKLDFIDGMDTVAIFSNLINNAIEACSSSARKDIFIDLYTVNNAFSVIKVENYADKEPIVVEGMLRSGKDDGNSHGIGIKSINNSLSKYDGKMSWSYDKAKGMFRTVISINNSQINI